MRLFPQLGIAVLLIALAVGGWLGMAGTERRDAGSAQPRTSGPVAVETAAVRLGTVTETVTAVGTSRAAKAVRIVSTVPGLVTRLTFEAGQRVEAGALLVELDRAGEQAAVREAEAELVNLRAQMVRSESLYTRKLLSAADLDELRGRLGVAQARLEAAQSRLEKRSIRAPFRGVVGLRNISPGDYVDSATLLTTLDQRDVMELEFRVPERWFGVVTPGRPVVATSVAFVGRTFTGTVRQVDTRIDPATRSFRVRAELPNPDAVLPDGLFMAVRLTIAERRRAVLVPEEAVIAAGGRSFVYVVGDGIAVRTAVTTGQRQDAAIEVLNGLAAGTEVVIKGQQSLRDRSPVRPAAPASLPVAGTLPATPR